MKFGKYFKIHILKFIAFMLGTFVTACPRCYRYFFGFQCYHEQFKVDDINYRIICNRCVKKIIG